MSPEEGSPIHIRRFRPSDGERIRELNEAAMATTPEYAPEIPDEDLQAVQRHYLDDEGEFLVGTVDTTIVAMGAYTTPNEWKSAYLELDGTTTELTRMRVDPAYHGRGYGSAIYRELERRAKAEGYQRVILDTGSENDVARGFYENLGFECRGEMTLEFEEFSFELALYEKCLVG